MGHADALKRGRMVAEGEGSEARATRAEIGDFRYKSSRAFQTTKLLFGPKSRLTELKAIVLIVCAFISRRHGTKLPRLTRSAERSCQLIIKYIDAHYDQMIPIMTNISLCDRNKAIIGTRAERPQAPPERPTDGFYSRENWQNFVGLTANNPNLPHAN